MPEGDTLARAARTLARWLEGRMITAASTRDGRIQISRLVGATLTHPVARGKHLLLPFDNGLTLRTHMKMTGSWHVYPAGERWRRPAHRAIVVLEAGDRVAVGFDIPDVQLERTVVLAKVGAVAELGPDILAEPLDISAILARVLARAAGMAMGEMLLDQRVVAGIGNMWRNEVLFAQRINPWTTVDAVAQSALVALFEVASALMKASVAGRRPKTQVYGRSGRQCRRCGELISSMPQGRMARIAYWCPNCQPGSPPATECG